MDVAVHYKRGQRPQATKRVNILGGGLLERVRSTSLALLGLTAAVGLGVIALALNQGWPLIAGAPIPGLPGAAQPEHHQARAGIAHLASNSPSGADLGRPRASFGGGPKPAPAALHGGSSHQLNVAVSAPTAGSGGGSGSPESPAPETPASASPAPESPAAGSSPAPTQPTADPPAPIPTSEGSAQPVVAPSTPTETAAPATGPPSSAHDPVPAGGGHGYGHGWHHGGGKGVSEEPGHVGEPPSVAASPPPPSEAPVEDGDPGEPSPPSESGSSSGHAYGHDHGHGHHW